MSECRIWNYERELNAQEKGSSFHRKHMRLTSAIIQQLQNAVSLIFFLF